MNFKTIFSWILLIGLLAGIMLFAKSIFDNKTFKVQFDTDGGSVVEAIEVKENTKIVSLPITIKDGYRFLGWYLNNELYDLNKEVTENVTLTAKWEENSQKSYTLSFDTLGGEKIEPILISDNNDIVLPNPSRDGYQFLGWYYHNKEFLIETNKINTNMTLIAKWEKTKE